MSVAKMEKRTEVRAKIKLEAKAMLKNIKKLVESIVLKQLYSDLNYSPPHRLFLERKKGKEEGRQPSLRRKSQRSQVL